MSGVDVHPREAPATPVRRDGAGRAGARPTAMVVVLGHTAAGLEAVVEQLALQQLVAPSVDPVFLTDQAEAALFQRHGWVFEYVMPYDDWCRFRDPAGWVPALRRRLASMVRSFRPALLVQFTTDAARERIGDLSLHAVSALAAEDAELGPGAARQQDLERTVARLQDRIHQLERTEKNRRAAAPVRAMLTRVVPRGSVVLMVAKGDPALAAIPDLKVWPFPQGPGGVYAGYNPADSSEAVGHLEALRGRGAEYIVFPAAYFWWLEHYGELRDYLDRTYRRLLDHPECVIFALAGAPGAPGP